MLINKSHQLFSILKPNTFLRQTYHSEQSISRQLLPKFGYNMDEDSIAKNKPKRNTKANKQPDREKDKERERKEAITNVDSTQSDSALVVKLKRKHVYDSLEHCRATSSGAKPKSKAVKRDDLKSVTSDELAEEEADTLEYVRSLSSKSSSKSSRFHDTSIDGKPYNLKITTWNINGLRNWLSKRSGLSFIAQDDADIYCFQEIKCGDSKIPAEIKNIKGYNTYWNGSDESYAGVVCFSKKTPKKVTYGIGNQLYDIEGRVITLEFDKFYVINVYVPNAGRGLVRYDFRMKWDADFLKYLKDLDSRKPVIVCGDLNVSHHEIDLANPKTNLKTAGFTIGERNNLQKILDGVDLIDVFRYLNPGKPECYTFWTYMRNAREKNVGWRLDYFLLSKRWMKKICDCIIRADIYGSDHCPVSIFLST